MKWSFIAAPYECQRTTQGDEQPSTRPVDPARAPVAQKLHRLRPESGIGQHRGHIDCNEDESEQSVLCQSASNRDPIPVALFDRSCWWRDIALLSLEASGRSYEVVFTSESSVGILAAVESGIAVDMLSTEKDLAGLDPVDGLTARNPTFLVLQQGVGSTGPVCDAMCDAIRRAFSD